MATAEVLAPNLVQRRQTAGLWSDAFGRLRKNKLAMVGLVLVILLFLIAIFGPMLAPWPYQVQDLAAVVANGGRALPPGSPNHLLGTDQIGRDLLSRLLDGARISMTVAIVVQVVVLLIGVPIGALAGWFGGRLDNILMRFTDVMYAFPDLLFIILLSIAFRETFFGKALDGLLLVFVAIGLTSWVTVARLVRGQILSLKETEFVEAARAIGVGQQDRDPSPAAQRDRADHRCGHPRDPGGDPGRGHPGIHRNRGPGAACVVGQPDRRWPEGRPGRSAPRALPRDLHRGRAGELHIPG